jgi:hypothetical protein
MINKAIDAIGILMFAILLLPFVAMLPALPLAFFSVATGIAIAPSVAVAIGFPIALYAANNIVNTIKA